MSIKLRPLGNKCVKGVVLISAQVGNDQDGKIFLLIKVSFSRNLRKSDLKWRGEDPIRLP